MLDEQAGAPAEEGSAAEPVSPRRHAALGPSVARIAAAVEAGDLIVVACSEQRAEALARAAAAATDAAVLLCPPSDAMPGDAAPASPAVAGRRVAALTSLRDPRDRPVLLVTAAAAAAEKLAPPEAFAAAPLRLAPGDRVDAEALAGELEAIGYFTDERVDEPGEMAVRSATIDIFPADAERPIRLHLKEGRVERIGRYDPASQIGDGEDLDQAIVYPAAEPEPGADAATLFDHLQGAPVLIDPEAEDRRARHAEFAREAGAPAERIARASDWARALKNRDVTELAEGGESAGRRFVELARPDRSFLAALKEARGRGDRVVVAGSARDLRFFARRLEQRLGEAPRAIARWREVGEAEPGALLAIPADLERGWTAPGLMVAATADVLGARANQAGAAAVDPFEQEIAQFRIGDAVIHEDHGLGLLRGVESVATGALEGDAIRVEYAGGAQRLIPVAEAGRLWRYGGDPEAVTLDRLDGSSWERRRGEIDEAMAGTARRLIALAGERDERTAPKLEPPVGAYERFAAGFPFTETPDQARAIEAVMDDLAAGRPMDRLVVGDVGYGKTEVALRAAAAAALAGKQVALIAPTTVLVRQHVETFRRRFARIGIGVAGLSRLDGATQQREVREALADGSMRIVIGTKMIAGKRVSFADLGLVVIDEEQRFGAADKARLRALGEGVHVLTLTATPIPRTLQGALVGLQELSLIATPPARRLPTRTSVAAWDPELVKPALLRERRRGGQSFVVVPRIEDMGPMAERLSALVPNLRLIAAHGKMPAAEIDEAMIGFAAGEADILLATNIVEAGLDIPRANTMLVWRADRFGLAQLHQLRGRVGRGARRGALMLLTEPGAGIAPATLKRLRTLENLDRLGAGFAISARDLDLRGAGELIGEEQAGHLALIGLGLYQRLLEQALRSARGEEVDDWMPDLNLGLKRRLPADWIPEEEVRINLYARLARLSSAAEIDALADELEDRFGSLPEEAQTLLSAARLRQLAWKARIARIDAGPAAIALTPRPEFAGDAEAAGLEPKGDRLLLREASEPGAPRLERLQALLETLIPES